MAFNELLRMGPTEDLSSCQAAGSALLSSPVVPSSALESLGQ